MYNASMYTLSPRVATFCFIALLAVASFLLFFRLGSSPFIDYDEAIYSQVIADTHLHDSFITLYQGSAPTFMKPPLYFWLAMGSEHIFSNTELAFRFPAAVIGLLAIILAYLIAVEITGNRTTGLLAGTILLTTGAFLESSRQLLLDVPVATTILFALFCYLRGHKNPWWYVGIAASIGLGVLFKSVIGLIAIVPIGLLALTNRNFRWLTRKQFWLGVFAMFAIALPWHVYEAMRFGNDFISSYFGHEIFGRLSSNVIGGSYSTSLYLQYTFFFTIPWILIYIAGWAWTLISERQRRDASNKTINALGASVLIIFLVFSLAQTKLFHYLLPAFFLMAIFCALVIERFIATRKEGRGQIAAAILILLCFGFANAIFVGYHYQEDYANNDIIVADEYAIAKVVASRPEPYDIKGFEYYYWDTLRYYSGHQVGLLKNDDVADKPFYLVIVTALYDKSPFPPLVMQHLQLLYHGKDLSLLIFDPKTK